MDELNNIEKAQEKFESESGGGGKGRYFMLMPDNIKDGADITFMTDIIKIEYGGERLDGSAYPDPNREGHGLDDAGGKHCVYQCDLYVIGGWDTFANAPYDQNAYMTFWFTKDPNNIRYPGLAGLIRACKEADVDIAKIKGTKWHVEAITREGSNWYDIKWTYLGREDFDALTEEDAKKTFKIINEVTKNGETTCAKPSLIIRMSNEGINTINRQEDSLKKLIDDKKIKLDDNTIKVL